MTEQKDETESAWRVRVKEVLVLVDEHTFDWIRGLCVSTRGSFEHRYR